MEELHRIRYYGFLANCHRERKLALCRELLGMAPIEPTAAPPADYRDCFEALTKRSLRECPHCHTGTMVVIGCIARPTVCQPVPNTSWPQTDGPTARYRTAREIGEGKVGPRGSPEQLSRSRLARIRLA